MAVHEDCFAYDRETRSCDALNALYCQSEECKFFATVADANAAKLASIRRRSKLGLPLLEDDWKFLKELRG